jgi:hypothetical protein
MSIERIRVSLTGGPGGAGVSTFYALDAAALQPDLITFMNVWRNLAPNDVTWHIPDTGDIINEESGDLTGVWTGGADGGFSGTDTGAYVAGAGVRARWLTSGIVAGRRVAGATFLCPLGAANFSPDGLPSTTFLATMLDACNDLVSATPGNMVVWSRPSGSRLGSKHPVVSASIPVQSSYLTSRRR